MASDVDAPRGETSGHFINQIIGGHLAEKRYDTVVTRFPPEPNGYLHIGHAKSICLNFGLAAEYGGRCHMRFDDTNPSREDVEFVESIQHDIRWLGFEWGEHLYHASDYFERMADFAERLIERGRAYVDSQTVDEIRAGRGSLTEAGTPSPDRDRSVAENLRLFREMKAGQHADGTLVLRARIDMAAPNMLMRDPLLYRIRHVHHQRTGDAWPIYPMYDYAHCLSDAIEGISHSICTLEFENNRELYDWILDEVGFTEPRPHQYEFARLALEYTVMSKRILRTLVEDGHVSGWDDPRMPTLAAYRRRGVRPDAIRAFCDMIGVAKANSMVDMAKLEYAIRDDLNHVAPRVMAILEPLEVEITNYPEDHFEQLEASYWPHDVPKEGTRPVPFSRHLYLERGDFTETPAKGWHRLAPGREVRLRYAYYITCHTVVKDDAGNVVKLLCSYDPATRGGTSPDGRKVKGTLHWVSATESVPAEVRIYDRLFCVPAPGKDGDFLDDLNVDSLRVVQARVEPSLAGTAGGAHFQFERKGYFFTDPVDSQPNALVFNKVVGLRDSWAKKKPKGKGKPAPKPADRKATPASASDDARTRPDKLSPAERRAKARAADATLQAAYERLAQVHADDVADVLSADRALVAFFDAAVARHDDAETVAKWTVNVLLAELKDQTADALPFDGAAFGTLIALVERNAITGRAAKTVLAAMLAGEGDPETIVDTRNLRQMNDDDALAGVVDEVIAAHPDQVARYREGAGKLFGFFVGQVMQATRGKANPQTTQRLLRQRLDG